MDAGGKNAKKLDYFVDVLKTIEHIVYMMTTQQQGENIMTQQQRLIAISTAMIRLYEANPQSEIAAQFVKAYFAQDVNMISQIVAKFEEQISHLSVQEQEAILTYHVQQFDK